MIAGNTFLKDISKSNDLTRELLLQLCERFSLYHYGITDKFLYQTQIRSNSIEETSNNYFVVYASAHRFYYKTHFGCVIDFEDKVIDEYTTVDELSKMIGKFVLRLKQYKMSNDLNSIKEDFE